ncbi:hypothetical protein L5G28_00605 [Gordonia sp. HY285]|uniref:Uncharacterized protein n=1 Tax=Gordonia liuliyuniae TaxID=2911517 RepID=A0ABS9IPL9_9ACTN|nr:hypothetical protein [Gordonia liuliyuniae]MCF8587506.1 hypothetical protein [Gordonia liuliyuniae]MCF8608666.1 hypothetical protein [Gordonia liuliyuniae]
MSADRHMQRTVDGSGHPDGLWLNDDTPSASFTVRVPVDVGQSQTRIRLRGSTQVGHDAMAFLAVTVDGDQVDRSELSHGDGELERTVDVPEGAVADGQVRVQLRLDGSLHDQTCSTDHSTGANVHIAADTVVEAELDEPVGTVRDVVASWDDTVTVVVPNGENPWRTVAAQLGVGLTQSGHRVTYTDSVPDDRSDLIMVGTDQQLNELGWSASSDDPISVGTIGDMPALAVHSPSATEATRQITGPLVATADGTGGDPRRVPSEQGTLGDVDLGDLGADLATATVVDSHTWRVSYSLADLSDGHLPASARVGWHLPASPPDLTWIVDTSLNGRLIDSRPVRRDRPVTTIALPAEAQRIDNTLTFTVQRDRDLGGCDVRQTPYSMALDPDSVLSLGDDPGAGFTAIPRTLAPGFAVYVSATPAEDTVAVLNSAVPVLAQFMPVDAAPDYLWGRAPEPGTPFIQIGADGRVSTPVAVADGRLVSGSPPRTDVTAMADGVLVACGSVGNRVAGLVVVPVGHGATALPPFGTESAQVITGNGAVAFTADGLPIDDAPRRAVAPG